jgi:RNA polymerase sigma-70 factor (ECF subfamily)
MAEDSPAQEPGAGYFATTRWSLILDAGTHDSPESTEALEELCRSYWRPIHAFVCRTGIPPESAKDLTQQFFATLIEKQWLMRADRERGRFRSFLLVYLKRFLSDEQTRAMALKRGGGREIVSLDELEENSVNGLDPASPRTPECEYDREWALATLRNALARLRAETASDGHQNLFLAVQGHLGDESAAEPLAEVAARFGLGDSALKMRLMRWRARYRDLIRSEVAQTVPRIADVDEELRHLMAALLDSQ